MESKLISSKITKIIFIIFTIISVIITVLGLQIFNRENKNEIIKAKTVITSISEVKRNEIINWFNRQLNNATEISNNEEFSKIIENIIAHPSLPQNHNHTELLINRIKNILPLKSIFILNRNGIIKFESINQNKLTEQEITSALTSLDSGKINTSNFIKSNNTINLDLFIPIKSNENIKIGIIVIRLDLKDYFFPLLNNKFVSQNFPKSILVQEYRQKFTIVNEDSISKILNKSHFISLIEDTGQNFTTLKILNQNYYFLSLQISGTNSFLINYVPEDYILKTSFIFRLLSIAFIFAFLFITGFFLVKIIIKYFSTNYQSFIEEASDGIFISDDSGNFLHANKAACELVGVPLSKLIKLKVTDLILPEDIAQKPLSYKLLMEGKKVLIERKIKRQDGKIIPVEINAKALPGKKVHAVVRDITQRIENQNALVVAKEKYKSLIENINEIVYDLDSEGKISWVSPTITKLASIPSENIIGNKFIDFIAEEDKHKAIKEFECNKKGFNNEIELKIKLNNGNIRWIRSKSISMFEEGKFLGTQGLIRDITETKLAEERLKHSELQFRSLFENANDAILLIQYNNIIDCNSVSESLFKSSKNDLILKSLADISIQIQNNGKNTEDLLNKKFELARLGKPQTFPLKFIKFDESTFDAEISLNNISINGDSVIQVVIRDITEKIKAEQDLKKSEEKYKQLIEQAADGIFIADATGNFLLVNDKACEMLGYTEDELLTMKIKDTYEMNYDDTNLTKINNLKSHEILSFERLMKRKDASTLPVEVRVKHLQDNRIQAIVRDISYRKKSEEILKESEERYRSMFYGNSSAMISIDPENKKVINANEAAAEFYGYPVEELKNMEISNITTLTPDQIETDIQNSLARKNNHFYRRHKAFNGVIKNVEIFSTPIIIKGKTILYSIIHDITERIKAEEKLTIINRAIEQSPVSIIITDMEGTIEYVNPKFCETTGYSFEEIIGKNPRILKSGKMSPVDYKVMWKTITSGSVWRGEIQNKRKGGQLFWEYASISPIKNQNGVITKYVGIKENITSRKKMIEELIQAKLNAEEMNRLKTNFLTNMSHELRTPMIGILGYAELLKNELDNPEFKEMSETIYKSGRRLLETLNLILDMSKVESNKMVINKKETDLSSLLFELTKLFLSAANSKNLYLEYSYKSNINIINTDERLLRESLNNLINNAIKFTKSGGIKIEVFDFVQDGSSYLNISVIDTGIGIEHNDKEIIFEEFRQASEGLNRNFEGTGIGLTLTKKFVEFINGKITVTSKQGKGSTFSIILPVESKPSNGISEVFAPVIISDASPEKSDKHIKILMVENDEASRKVMMTMLKKIASIDTAVDGLSAVEKASKEFYDVILMDINLGHGMNGLQATSEIRKIKRYKETPIIAVTAFAMAGDKEEFLSSGCTDYLAKPFSKDKLISTIENNLTVKSEN